MKMTEHADMPSTRVAAAFAAAFAAAMLVILISLASCATGSDKPLTQPGWQGPWTEIGTTNPAQPPEWQAIDP